MCTSKGVWVTAAQAKLPSSKDIICLPNQEILIRANDLIYVAETQQDTSVSFVLATAAAASVATVLVETS